MSNTTTAFSDRCNILGELWMSYKDDPIFHDFIDYNDIGLPLAFCVSQEIIPTNDTVINYINETWDLFIEGLEIQDIGYSNLDEVFLRFDNPD